MGDHDTKSEPQLRISFIEYCKNLLSIFRFLFLWAALFHFAVILAIFTANGPNASLHINPSPKTVIMTICSVLICLFLCIVFMVVDAMMLYYAYVGHRKSSKVGDRERPVSAIEKGKGVGEPRKRLASIAEEVENGNADGGQSKMKVDPRATKMRDAWKYSPGKDSLGKNQFFRARGSSKNLPIKDVPILGSGMKLDTAAAKPMDGPGNLSLRGDHLFRELDSPGHHCREGSGMDVETGATKEIDGPGMYCLEGDNLSRVQGPEEH
ncbi:MAG: hypothetical protein Q9212_005479 [Teloschistes hypoglaucus]